ncbi:MAG: DUF6512 family protein [Eubacteriales bacterium]
MTLKQWTWLGFFFTLVLGTMLHFTYGWSGENAIIGSFSAVNESTWEHLKLLFIPTFIFTILQYAYLRRDYYSIFITNFIGALIGMLLIITFFYSYEGVLGKNMMFLDIFAFLLGTSGTYLFSYLSLKRHWLQTPFLSNAGVYFQLLLLLLFITFTMNPPTFGMFIPPT